MTTLNDVVDLQIRRDTQSVDRASFGIPLFMVEDTVIGASITERVKSYSSMEGVAVDYAATDVAYLMAQAAFSQEIRPSRVKIGLKGTDETYVVALTAAVAFDDDFYGIACETVTAADILLIAAWVEARMKIYIARSADADILTVVTTDVASNLGAAEYNRTAVIYHSLAVTQYADAAWLGNSLVRDPGSQTWAFKTLTGITFDNLNSGEADFAKGKNANTYERIAGVNVTLVGTVASGEYIDVMRGLDWLDSRMKERIFGALANSPKIPFTNTGIAIVENLVRAQLEIAVTQGVIDTDYTVSVPDVLDVDEADRILRRLTQVTFRARLQGAIHLIVIRGSVFA